MAQWVDEMFEACDNAGMERDPDFNPVVRVLALQAQADKQAFLGPDEAPSPEDKEILRRYIKGEIGPGSEAAKAVEDWVTAFRSYYRLFCDVIAEELST